MSQDKNDTTTDPDELTKLLDKIIKEAFAEWDEENKDSEDSEEEQETEEE